VSALLIFGGATLKDFAFALLVGIGSGAYSTIFIATPILGYLMEREPEYAKRKLAGLQEKLGRDESAPGNGVPTAEPSPAPEPVAAAPEPAAPIGDGSAAARREARRKRRRARPHGRSR